LPNSGRAAVSGNKKEALRAIREGKGFVSIRTSMTNEGGGSLDRQVLGGFLHQGSLWFSAGSRQRKIEKGNSPPRGSLSSSWGGFSLSVWLSANLKGVNLRSSRKDPKEGRKTNENPYILSAGGGDGYNRRLLQRKLPES